MSHSASMELYADGTTQAFPSVQSSGSMGVDLVKCQRPSCTTELLQANRQHSTVNHHEIRRHVSAAQRGNQSNVQPVPSSSRSQNIHTVLPLPLPSPSGRKSSGSSQQQLPRGRAPGPAGQGQPFIMPPLAVSVPTALCHPQAQDDYKETREILRKRAQMGSNAEHSVVLKMRLVSENVEHVPSTISKVNLMNLILHGFRGQWLEEYHGHSLELHHIRALLDSKHCNLDDDGHPIQELCLPGGKPKKGKDSQHVIVEAVVDASLVKDAEFYREMHSDPNSQEEEHGFQVATNGFLTWMSGARPVVAEVFFNTAQDLEYGTFKSMRRGRIHPPPFRAESPDGRVALKQLRDRRVDGSTSLSAGNASNVSVEERVGQLAQDALATVWAAALLQLVYDFIKSYHQDRSPLQCPWGIPSFRYVRTGLALTNTSPRDKDVYLVEELVDSNAEGPWRKYLNNNTARHRFTHDKDPANFKRAEFLTFCQHVQYWKTCGQAFITDFQGGDTLLSDPQIITDPHLGRDLFCKGNISNTHRSFERDHVCNIRSFYLAKQWEKVTVGAERSKVNLEAAWRAGEGLRRIRGAGFRLGPPLAPLPQAASARWRHATPALWTSSACALHDSPPPALESLEVVLAASARTGLFYETARHPERLLVASPRLRHFVLENFRLRCDGELLRKLARLEVRLVAFSAPDPAPPTAAKLIAVPARCRELRRTHRAAPEPRNFVSSATSFGRRAQTSETAAPGAPLSRGSQNSGRFERAGIRTDAGALAQCWGKALRQ
ncbi:hypothetical protein DENSPDRAFT_850264 [Dentipellis sp. KUC8613]|nr:hypothetical protein DENSPDRAFT_850264 [Dentipellis sp. KUC8613]